MPTKSTFVQALERGEGRWQPLTHEELSQRAKEVQARNQEVIQRVRQRIAQRGKVIADQRSREYLTTSNNATAVKKTMGDH